LLVEQGLASARCSDPKSRHAVDCVDGEAEAVGLVANRQLQWCIDIALLFLAAHVDVVLMGPMIG